MDVTAQIKHKALKIKIIINKVVYLLNKDRMNQELFALFMLAGLLVIGCVGQSEGISDICLRNDERWVFEYIGEGCILDLSNPVYGFCPNTLSIPFPSPALCGLKNTKWQNYTYPCEAYLDKADGFYNATCTCAFLRCSPGFICHDGNCLPENTCEGVNCPTGFQCVEGQCQAIPEPQPQLECTTDSQCKSDERCISNECMLISCDNVKCGEYEDCEYGVCFRKFDYFCSRVQPKVLRHYCSVDRPTQQQCPTTTFLPPFAPTFCSVSYNNEREDFATACEACKRNFVAYYYAQSCDSLPEYPAACDQASECINGQCTLKDYCEDIDCPRGTYCNSGLCLPVIGFCESDADCESGLVCNADNLCDVEVIIDVCDGVTCPAGERCVSGTCVGNCLYSNCPAGTTCSPADGNCYTDRSLCVDDDGCETGQICLLGKCYTPITPAVGAGPCDGVLCGEGKKCEGGICVLVDRCSTVLCAGGETCIQGICVDACLTVSCGQGEVCRLGTCVDICSTIQCPIGMRCEAGECVMDLDPCQGVRCAAGQVCESGSCVVTDRCLSNSHTSCAADAICLNTRCIRDHPCISDINCYGAYCFEGFCRSQPFILN